MVSVDLTVEDPVFEWLLVLADVQDETPAEILMTIPKGLPRRDPGRLCACAGASVFVHPRLENGCAHVMRGYLRSDRSHGRSELNQRRRFAPSVRHQQTRPKQSSRRRGRQRLLDTRVRLACTAIEKGK